jgi:hypothetical protein
VTSITDKAFDTLLSTFEREAIHLEMRDAYGTTVELPHMARWAAAARCGTARRSDPFSDTW